MNDRENTKLAARMHETFMAGDVEGFFEFVFGRYRLALDVNRNRASEPKIQRAQLVNSLTLG